MHRTGYSWVTTSTVGFIQAVWPVKLLFLGVRSPPFLDCRQKKPSTNDVSSYLGFECGAPSRDAADPFSMGFSTIRRASFSHSWGLPVLAGQTLAAIPDAGLSPLPDARSKTTSLAPSATGPRAHVSRRARALSVTTAPRLFTSMLVSPGWVYNYSEVRHLSLIQAQMLVQVKEQ